MTNRPHQQSRERGGNMLAPFLACGQTSTAQKNRQKVGVLLFFARFLLGGKTKTLDNQRFIKRFEYPERDLNPHSRNGQRILSPSCLPFHHPGSLPCAEGAGGKAQQSYAIF